jgi:sugar O-acyltransferase (sialic acid O-acetyltransferase NeuD family)
MKPALLLIGGGGHCRSCIDVVESNVHFSIAGIVQPKSDSSGKVLGYPVLGCDDELPELVSIFKYALVTIGQVKNVQPRISLFEKLKELKAELPIVKSPLAYVSRHATLAEGTIIMHGAIVNANSTVGPNCIVNSQSLIEHDVAVGSHCHVSTGARINGGVSLGEGCFIGSGVIVREGVSIGEYSVVGAGQVVMRDIEPRSVLRGKNA